MSPYYVINYETSGATDGVTKGLVNKTIKIFRNTILENSLKNWNPQRCTRAGLQPGQAWTTSRTPSEAATSGETSSTCSSARRSSWQRGSASQRRRKKAEEGKVRRLVPAEEAGPVSYWVSPAVNLQRRERRKVIAAGVTHSEAPSVGSIDPNPVASEEEEDDDP